MTNTENVVDAIKLCNNHGHSTEEDIVYFLKARKWSLSEDKETWPELERGELRQLRSILRELELKKLLKMKYTSEYIYIGDEN